MTWEHLVKLEPQLLVLYNEARSYHDRSHDDPFCANKVWYGAGGLKQQMFKLVGDYAQDEHLKNSTAYDIAYQTIYYALPNCRDCEHFG